MTLLLALVVGSPLVSGGEPDLSFCPSPSLRLPPWDAQQETAPARTEEVVVVGKRIVPSPAWTQDRVFPGTRFWRLDYGKIEFETWWRGKIRGGDDNDEHLYQIEAEIGIWPGVQLDLYENIEQNEGDSPRQEGAQIEVRLSPFDYGEVFANPVLYLEWHPRHFEADKLETRLLFGGELCPGWVGATNLKYEWETGGAYGVEYGWTGGASYEVVEEALRLGAEAKVTLERETGTPVVASFGAGPNLLWKPLGPRFKVMFTGFLGIDDDAPDFEPILIFGLQF